MTQLIIHPGTGTVIGADECLVLDEDQVSDAIAQALANGDDVDDALVALACIVGTPILRKI